MSALLGGGGSGTGSGRTIITTNTTYHVATTGSDTTGDGSVGNPWQTIQHAVNYVMYNITGEGVTVAIQVADGTYAEQIFLGPHQVFDSTSVGFATVFLLFSDKTTPAGVQLNPGVSPPRANYGNINCINSNWQIGGGVTITNGALAAAGCVFTVLMGALLAIVTANIVVADACNIMFDVEAGGNLDVAADDGSGYGVGITFSSTVGTLVVADEGATVEFYGGTTFTFGIDPGFNGSLGGAWVANFGGGCAISSRATYAGSAAATPSLSKVSDGNTIYDKNDLVGLSGITVGEGSSYSTLTVEEVAGTLAATTFNLQNLTGIGGATVQINDGGKIESTGSGSTITLQFSPSTGGTPIDFIMPTTATFRVAEFPIFGASDLLFQGFSAGGAGYTFLEDVSGQGMVVGTALTSSPVLIAVNRGNTARFDAPSCLTLPTTTVGGLPGAPFVGQFATVSDALAPAIGVAVGAGGAAFAAVCWNGAQWTVFSI